jgi:hypothetical protein
MRELHLRLRGLEPMSRHQLWRETFFFLASFVATMGGSIVLMNHAAAVMA